MTEYVTKHILEMIQVMVKRIPQIWTPISTDTAVPSRLGAQNYAKISSPTIRASKSEAISGKKVDHSENISQMKSYPAIAAHGDI